MAIAYPVTLPSTPAPRRITPKQMARVGLSMSPLTDEQQVYAHQGGLWGFDVEYAPMARAAAEDLLGILLSLNGREGTFLMSMAANKTARGTWASASPVVNGAGQSGRSMYIRGMAQLATGKAGDWFSLGSGSSTHLHKLLQAFTIAGSPDTVLAEFWPRLRSSPADGAAITVSDPKCLCRLASNEVPWSIEEAVLYGISFSCHEAL